MLYLGHFTFAVPESGATVEGMVGGWFTCVAAADSADEAIEKFQDYLEDLKRWHVAFKDVGNIYFESGLELREPPEQPVLGYFTLTGPVARVGGVPSMPSEVPGVATFVWQAGGEREDDLVPFLSLE